MSSKVCKIFSLFWWYLLSTWQPLGSNASSMSCIIVPSPAPTYKGKHNWLQNKVITEKQFLSSVHSDTNFQCLSCPCCWNVHVFHSHFHSELVHCTSVFSWVEKAAQPGFLKLFPMTTLLVNPFTTNQTEYPSSNFLLNNRIKCHPCDKSWLRSQGSPPLECHLAWLTQELLHTHSILIDTSAFPLYN